VGSPRSRRSRVARSEGLASFSVLRFVCHIHHTHLRTAYIPRTPLVRWARRPRYSCPPVGAPTAPPSPRPRCRRRLRASDSCPDPAAAAPAGRLPAARSVGPFLHLHCSTGVASGGAISGRCATAPTPKPAAMQPPMNAAARGLEHGRACRPKLAASSPAACRRQKQSRKPGWTGRGLRPQHPRQGASLPAPNLSQ
jgi:hypothetical protein